MTVHLLFPLLLAVASEPRPCCPQPQGQETGGLLLIHLVPKRFATLVEVDPVRRKVKLHVEGEEEAADWDVVPDAEIKVHGWWGRLDQLHEGDRVWVWFQVDREKERTAVLFLADEISEQKIHREPYVLETVDEQAGTITFGAKRREGRTLKLDPQLEVTARGADEVYLQAAGDELRLLVPESRLFDLQAEQRSRMHAIWKEEGLPSTVSVLHPFGGELELMVDHQGMRWSRSLRPGDEVELIVDPPIRGVVAKVEPWRERTRLRLAVRGEEQSVLAAGQRLGVRM